MRTGVRVRVVKEALRGGIPRGSWVGVETLEAADELRWMERSSFLQRRSSWTVYEKVKPSGHTKRSLEREAFAVCLRAFFVGRHVCRTVPLCCCESDSQDPVTSVSSLTPTYPTSLRRAKHQLLPVSTQCHPVFSIRTLQPSFSPLFSPHPRVSTIQYNESGGGYCNRRRNEGFCVACRSSQAPLCLGGGIGWNMACVHTALRAVGFGFVFCRPCGVSGAIFGLRRFVLCSRSATDARNRVEPKIEAKEVGGRSVESIRITPSLGLLHACSSFCQAVDRRRTKS